MGVQYNGRIIVNENGEQIGIASNPLYTTETGGSLTPATDLEGGGQVTVGTSPIEVSFTGTTKSIIIRADNDNTGLIYVGKSNVTNTGSNAFTFLNAGDSITIDYDDSTNAIYVVSDTASQNIWKGATL